jgi:hypothetical protein
MSEDKEKPVLVLGFTDTDRLEYIMANSPYNHTRENIDCDLEMPKNSVEKTLQPVTERQRLNWMLSNSPVQMDNDYRDHSNKSHWIVYKQPEAKDFTIIYGSDYRQCIDKIILLEQSVKKDS